MAELVLAGCAIVPPERSDWPADRLSAPSAAGILTPVKGGTLTGSGAIIHACAEHGVVILTARHVIEDAKGPHRVWLFLGPEETWVELPARLVFPPASAEESIFGSFGYDDLALLVVDWPGERPLPPPSTWRPTR